MNVSIEESSLLDPINASNLSFLNDYKLDQNEKYSFLKDSLYIFKRSSPSPTSKKVLIKSSHFQSQLHSNLHNLLLQIIYTKDAETQSKLIEKTYSWYLQRSGISRTQTPSMSSLSPKPSKSPLPEARIFKELKTKRNQQELLFKRRLGYLPRSQAKQSKESLIEQINERYQKMTENEKVSFFSPVKPVLMQKPKEKTESPERVSEKSPSTKQQSIRTPELPADQFTESPLQSPSMDFRRVAHKFRMIKPVNLDRETDQIPFALAEEVAKVKTALTKQDMHIDSKTLENGLCVHQKVKLNTSSQKKLPTGGELLLRYPVSSIIKSSSTTKRKKQRV